MEIDEVLPEEIIDVFNQGGGRLNWTCECEDDWIEVKKFKGHIKLKLNPGPGTNRGRVYIRDLKSGQAKRIQIKVKLNDSARPPKLQITEKFIDFGNVSRDASLPSQSIRLFNLGDGALQASATSKQPWIKADLFGDILEISVRTGEEGSFSGSVRIDSAGGSKSVPVNVVIEPGPVLKVTPVPINFLTNKQGSTAEKQLKIRNTGKGELVWEFKTKGSFFSAEQHGDVIDLTLDTSEPGNFQGSVFITSNGGEKTIPVRALVKGVSESPPQQPHAAFVDIAGAWASAAGVGNFQGSGPNYQYQSANEMGVTIEQGTANVVGNVVTLQAYNIMTGNFTATLQVQGDIMSGMIVTPMGTMPLSLQKIQWNPGVPGIGNIW